MTGLFIYVVVSIIMSIFWTTLTFTQTELDEFSTQTKICFALYFGVANLLAWPVYCIYMASYILHDYKN